MKTVTIPDWLYNFLLSIYHNWEVIVGLAVSATLASLLVFIMNHKKARKYADKGLHILLLVISSFFAGLQALIPFIHEHLAVLQTLPYVGAYVVGIYAAANFLYALKYKAWFKAFVTWANSRSNRQPDAATVVPEPPTTQPVQEQEFTLPGA